MATKAVIVYKEIPGIEGIDPKIYRNNQFAQRIDFDFCRRVLLKARRAHGGVYEFSINGITYRARLIRDMEQWEKAYYANSPETCITELMNVYP